MGVCTTDCDPAKTDDCSSTCQALVDKYDIIRGLTWGTATQDVQAYFMLKECNRPRSGSAHLPQKCANWACSCRSAAYDASFGAEAAQWAKDHCWWLPNQNLLDDEKYG